VPAKPNTAPATAKPAVVIEVDVACNLVRVDFAGHVSAAEAKAGATEVERRLPQLRAGFSVLVDLTDLQSMDLDCVPHLAKIMDLFKAHGVGLVVRVDPDPAKDIGFNILSVIHYRGKVPVVVCNTIAEAARALKK
jgi:anti-anti-sigma regulatory factor